ncbi:unnamed protein product [Parnassius apollo]|uniref:(apollo) hypothetical protein n=1 Tax=Parnassius apollo TaxID=110799 RepID=A0A8S3XV70_PARAO|nr:unnamed protein product [Parnassius apollo]
MLRSRRGRQQRERVGEAERDGRVGGGAGRAALRAGRRAPRGAALAPRPPRASSPTLWTPRAQVLYALYCWLNVTGAWAAAPGALRCVPAGARRVALRWRPPAARVVAYTVDATRAGTLCTILLAERDGRVGGGAGRAALRAGRRAPRGAALAPARRARRRLHCGRHARRYSMHYTVG